MTFSTLRENSILQDNPPVMQLASVGVRFPAVRALHGIDLQVRLGETVAIVGPSGSGKTTLLRVLHGMQRPSTGTVSFEGYDLAHKSTKQLRRTRTQIGFVHQHLGLVPELRVIQNVITGRIGSMNIFGFMRQMFFPSTATQVEVYEILHQLGVQDKMFEHTRHLSGGQKQRVAMARAMFQRPRVLLADEPVSHVDPPRARETIQLLHRLCARQRLALIVSLHNLDVAKASFSRIIGLRQGEVVFDDSPDRITGEQFNALYSSTDQEY